MTAKVTATAAVRTLFGKLEGRGESQSYCCENLLGSTRQLREPSFTFSDTRTGPTLTTKYALCPKRPNNSGIPTIIDIFMLKIE